MECTRVRVLLLLLSLVVGSSGYNGLKRGLTSITDPVPATGDQRLLVLTVQYPSLGGSYTGSKWRKGLFEEWIQFFKAQSYNKLRYTVDIVTISKEGKPVINDHVSKNKYANGEHGWNFDSPWSLHTIVRDACSYLDSRGFNWAPYVQNGTIQNVLVMSAGYDYRYAEFVDKNPKWNYLLSTSFSGARYRTRNGFIVNSYTFCSEHTQSFESNPSMAYLGQCAHEFGHALGIPDLYDLSGLTSGVGYFDLLGYGIYANGYQDGSHHVGFGAWPKTTLGWSEPVVIRNKTVEVELGPVSEAAGNMLKVYPYEDNNETYLLIENRQSIDKWDKNFAAQYSDGILIWSINESECREFTPFNSVNTYPTDFYVYVPDEPAVVVMEADDKQDMSTISHEKKYGTSADVWQVGEQFILSKEFSVGVMSIKDKIYTLRISFNGPITMPDSLSSAVSPSISPHLLFLFVGILSLCTFLL